MNYVTLVYIGIAAMAGVIIVFVAALVGMRLYCLLWRLLSPVSWSAWCWRFSRRFRKSRFFMFLFFGTPDDLLFSAAPDEISDRSQRLAVTRMQQRGQLGDTRVIEPLGDVLNSGDYASMDLRVLAVETLGTLGDQRAVPPLRGLLSHQPPVIQLPAAISLASLGDASGVDLLIRELSSSAHEAAASALKKLDVSRDKLVDGYLQALQSHYRTARHSAAKALEALSISRDELVAGYIDALQSVSAAACAGAVEALVETRESRVVEPLLRALSDRRAEVRRSAANGLGMLADRRAVKPLISALRDDDSTVRRSAAKALEALCLPRDELVAGYVEALQSVSAATRVEAIEGLVKTRDDRAVELLIGALSDQREEVRRSAADGLGMLADPRAVQPLIRALSEDDGTVRRSAAKALEALCSSRDELVDGYAGALQSVSLDACIGAVEALVKTRDRRAVGPLIRALSDQRKDVRKSAAEGLGRLADERAVEPLIGALTDVAPGVRESAAISLGRLRDKRAVEPLRDLLYRGGDNTDIKHPAFSALCLLGDTSLLPALRRLLGATPPTYEIRHEGNPDDPYYDPRTMVEVCDNPTYAALMSAIRRLEGKTQDILPDVRRWCLVVPSRIRGLPRHSEWDTVLRLSSRSWLWRYGVDEMGKRRALARVQAVEAHMDTLIAELSREDIVADRDIVSIYLHGSHAWVDDPNDIDILIVARDDREYTYVPTKALSGGVTEIFREQGSLNMELVGIEALQSAVSHAEDTVSRPRLIARRRAVLLYGCVLLRGVDLFESSQPPVENFAILRDDLLRDARMANWPDIKDDPTKVEAKKRWRVFEASCLEKMFDLERVSSQGIV